MKTAIIIHGMPSKKEYYSKKNSDSPNNGHWLPWIQKQLLLKDILAQSPAMPFPYEPNYKEWKEVFQQFKINKNTILIGHSCGAGFIIRYLSEENIKVNKVILVAPYISPEKYKLAEKMFKNLKIDPNLSKKVLNKQIVIFSSTNDMKAIRDSVKILKEKIKNIKIKEFENYGHFCLEDMGTREFPELLDFVLN